MDKVANRAFRRVLGLFKGKRVPGKITNYDIADLSKPMWERRGFDSQESMLDAWRSRKRAMGMGPSDSSLDGTDALKDLDYSVGGNLKTFLASLFGKKPSTAGTPLGKRRNHNDIKFLHKHFGTKDRPFYEPTYSDAVNDYIKRRTSNDPALKRFKSLMRRYDVLHRSGIAYALKNQLNETPKGFLNYPFSVNEAAYGNAATMPRLYSKLWKLRNRNADSFSSWPFLAEAMPAARISREAPREINLPLVATFRAQKPFATTYHVASYKTTKSAMDAMDNAVDYLRSNGQPITAENIRKAMPEEIGNNLITANDVRVHAGDKYPDDIMQGLRSGYFGNRVNPNYEAVWSVGAPDYPDITALHVGDTPELRRIANEAGLSHIFKRDTVMPSQLQSADDMVLYKGTPIPVPTASTIDYGDPAAMTDEISTAYKDALQSHLKRGFDAPDYKGGKITYNQEADPTILGTMLDLPGHKKYPVGEHSWLTPSSITSAGYSREGTNIPLFPITADEARQLFSPRTSNKSVADMLDDVTPEERKRVADLVRHYGDFKQTEQFKDVVNKNIEQISDVVPRIKRNVPEPILRALLGDNSMLPDYMDNYGLRYMTAMDIIHDILHAN